MEHKKEKILQRFQKSRTALKSYCEGREYTKVLEAMTFAEKYHTGTRKDKITPEFQHQIDIALYATTLVGLTKQDESVLLQVILLHDVVEDYNVSLSEIEQRFGPTVTEAVEIISKKIDGHKKPMELYMHECANNLYAALAKGCDRINNVQSMPGAFTFEKMGSYGQEVKTFFLPMLRQARDQFPQYRKAFKNISHMLQSQVAWVDLLLESRSALEAELQKSSLPSQESLGL
jgi:GTP pyrophosphokinase